MKKAHFPEERVVGGGDHSAGLVAGETTGVDGDLDQILTSLAGDGGDHLASAGGARSWVSSQDPVADLDDLDRLRRAVRHQYHGARDGATAQLACKLPCLHRVSRFVDSGLGLGRTFIAVAGLYDPRSRDWPGPSTRRAPRSLS